MSKVYVLDYDVISPIGVGRSQTSHHLKTDYLAGKKLTHFQADGLPAVHGAEVVNSDLPTLERFSDAWKQTAQADRKFELSLAISEMVEDRFNAIMAQVAPNRRGIVFGMGLDITPVEFIAESLRKRLKDPTDAYFRTIYDLNQNCGRLNAIANPLDVSTLALANRMSLGAFQKTVLTACSASLQAMAYATKSIARGEADFVVTGGSDSLLNLAGYLAFSRLGVVTPTDGPLEKACKPLDINRSGVLVGEGSGAILLASEAGLKKSGRDPLFEITGVGNSMDAYKITAPDPEGVGMRRAIETAFLASGIQKHEVDYINLHGTGTRANDPAEIAAILSVFGEAGENIAVSSTKDRHGHTIGAAGVVELAVLFLSMENGLIPCTRNLEKPFIEKGLNLVRGENLKRKIHYGMSNSFALGGVNSSVVVKNYGG